MASIESILQLIVDRPGLTAAELGDELELASADVQSRLAKYITADKVRTDKKKIESGREVLTYFPGQSLVDEVDGVKRIVTASAAKRSAAPANVAPAASDFTFGFFSDGALSVSKGSREMRLTRDETARLLRFLDAINVELIASGGG